jgi:hypothetical protein
MDRMSDFWCQAAVWSQNTFGLDSQRGPQGPILHLLKEVVETLEVLGVDVSIDIVYTLRKYQDDEKLWRELIDCFFCVIDAARRSGLNYEKFMDLVFEKLEINKSANWPRVAGDENLPVEHDRTLDDKSTESLSCQEPQNPEHLPAPPVEIKQE